MSAPVEATRDIRRASMARMGADFAELRTPRAGRRLAEIAWMATTTLPLVPEWVPADFVHGTRR